MAWTYADLKAADAALSPIETDPGAAATALNAQTKSLTKQVFPWSATKLIARLSTTGDWSRIVARARLAPALPPVTASDAAILAAINATESADTDVIDPTNAATWAAFQSGLAVLVESGDLSAATVATITALSTPTVPSWIPSVTEGDVQTARGQP